jgi:hypothetical protein
MLTHEGQNIFARLKTRAEKWAAKVPLVLWSLQTMPNRLTNFTPIFIVHGSEDVLPSELQYVSHRVQAYQPIEAEQAW